jgi:adenylate cyclase
MSELQQRLAATLAADAAGYSRLMSTDDMADDMATVATLDAARAVFRAQIEAQQGRVIDMAGDSLLAVFGTAAGAVTAALSIQAQINPLADAELEHRRMHFRIGVHLGDVIEKADGTVCGDGVNIAARLQALAEPGGITVSESIRSAVKSKVGANVEDQGEQAVKNIADPVWAWRAALLQPGQPNRRPPHSSPLPPTGRRARPARSTCRCPTSLRSPCCLSSTCRATLVRSTSPTASAKRSSPSCRGKELGVRYMLEGSTRRSAQRIRVATQLIDAASGNHLWAEKYDRVLEDIFEVQEELTRSIVAAIAPHIEDAECEKVR